MAEGDEPARWWTVEEANVDLPRVADLVSRARLAVGAVAGHRKEMSARAKGNGHAQSPTGERDFGAVMAELEAEGIVLRDVERGLIDFPANTPGGRLYWLCWLVGEPAVEWWHWPEDGFPGRTPLSNPPR